MKGSAISRKGVMYLNISKPTAVLGIDTVITWYSQIAQSKCKCHLRIYKISFDKAIVIVSELEDNPGRSIADESSSLIYLVCDEFALSSSETMWFEHYPASYLKDDETYEQVTLVKDYTYSTRISKQKIEDLLGVKL